MAIAHSDKIKALVFLTVTIALATTIVLVLVGTNWMKKKDTYYIDFTEVKGITAGSPVRYNGVTIGTVKRIKWLSNLYQSRVTVEVQQNTIIKHDSVARLELDSPIVGSRFIQITPGTADSKKIEPNTQANIIKSERSTFDTIYMQAAEISSRSSVLISNFNNVFSPENARSFSSILDQVNKFIKENSTNATDVLFDFRTTLAAVRTAMEAAKIDATMTEVRTTLIAVQQAVASANEMMAQNQKSVNDTLVNMRAATDTLNELLINLNRQPALLLRGKGQEKKEWMDE
jgi:phospholipid/cholesterol/gamma-HCH transport system substrate-binding protein